MRYNEIPGYCDYHEFYRDVFEQLPEGAQVAEIGVYLGHSVAFMATLAKEAKKKITVHAIDTFMGSNEHTKRHFYNEFIDNIFKCGVSDNVLVLVEDSVKAAQIVPETFDFVFIDAAHDYQSVKADIEAWAPKVKKGGILAGHDYCRSWPGVMEAVDELIPNKQLNKSVWWTRL